MTRVCVIMYMYGYTVIAFTLSPSLSHCVVHLSEMALKLLMYSTMLSHFGTLICCEMLLSMPEWLPIILFNSVLEWLSIYCTLACSNSSLLYCTLAYQNGSGSHCTLACKNGSPLYCTLGQATAGRGAHA